MTAQFVSSDPISPENLKSLLAHYDQELKPVCESILALKPVDALGTSGTMEKPRGHVCRVGQEGIDRRRRTGTRYPVC